MKPLTDINWLKENETGIKNLLPETWTHVQNVSVLKIGFGLKLLGVNWQTEDELSKILVYLTHLGMIERDKMLIRRSPNTIFVRRGSYR